MSNQFTKDLGDIKIENGFLIRGNIKVNMQEVYNYYITENHSLKDTRAYFNLTPRMWEKIRDTLEIKKPRALSYEHNKKTLMELYGDEHYNNHQQQVQTCIDRYGCENVYQAESIKQKCEETKLAKYGNAHFSNKEKQQQTCIEKYGFKTPLQNSEIQEKARQTCLEHFGVEYPMQSKEVQAKYNFEESAKKAFETKKVNGTTNTSKIQKWFIAKLKEIYGGDQIEEDYNKDPRYPYHCDAYIKPLEQFIELNIYFTHGGHPFNPTDPEDLKLLAIWKDKAETSKFFTNAIKVWTMSDPEKQLCAKQNNLSYLTFYTEDEAIKFINNLEREIL